jgi:hypothetical protein
VSHLFFGDVLPFAFLGPIEGTGPLLLIAVSRWSCHINIECEIQTVSRRPLTYIPVTIYHVNAREWQNIDFHGELPQDQSALLFAVIGGMGK